MNHSDFYKSVYGESASDCPKPIASLQWKGTVACIDVWCQCGNSMHFDQDFLYYVRCDKCDKIFALDHRIKIIELNDDQREYAEKNCKLVIKSPIRSEE